MLFGHAKRKLVRYLSENLHKEVDAAVIIDSMEQQVTKYHPLNKLVARNA